VRVLVQPCDEVLPLADDSVDFVLASNLLEHLTPAQLDRTLENVKRVLAPGGRFVAIQPNFRLCAPYYFDDFTHVTVFSHVSLADLLAAHGFEPIAVVPGYLPLTMQSRWPTVQWLVSFYLRLPYRPGARQMLVAARTAPGADSQP
jgi:SAM-dependent methyltransferase